MAPKTSLIERVRIVKMLEKMSPWKVALQTGRSYKTIKLWQKREEISEFEVGKRTGRPKITTEEQNRQFVEYVEQNPFCTMKKLFQHFGLNTEEISEITVRRRLHASGLVNMSSEAKPRMTAAHRAARVRFAQEHADWTLGEWERVIFSDEKIFTDGRSHAQNVWRRRGELDPELHYQHITSSNQIAVNIWGAISPLGFVKLYDVGMNFDSTAYLNVLSNSN